MTPSIERPVKSKVNKARRCEKTRSSESTHPLVLKIHSLIWVLLVTVLRAAAAECRGPDGGVRVGRFVPHMNICCSSKAARVRFSLRMPTAHSVEQSERYADALVGLIDGRTDIEMEL